jgi:hypothetical protein
VQAVESGLSATTAKFDAGLASLVVLQQRQQVFGMVGVEAVKRGFHHVHSSGAHHSSLVHGVQF